MIIKVKWIFEYDNKIEPLRQAKKRKIIWNIMSENGDRNANTEDNNKTCTFLFNKLENINGNNWLPRKT